MTINEFKTLVKNKMHDCKEWYQDNEDDILMVLKTITITNACWNILFWINTRGKVVVSKKNLDAFARLFYYGGVCDAIIKYPELDK